MLEWSTMATLTTMSTRSTMSIDYCPMTHANWDIYYHFGQPEGWKVGIRVNIWAVVMWWISISNIWPMPQVKVDLCSPGWPTLWSPGYKLPSVIKHTFVENIPPWLFFGLCLSELLGLIKSTNRIFPPAANGKDQKQGLYSSFIKFLDMNFGIGPLH